MRLRAAPFFQWVGHSCPTRADVLIRTSLQSDAIDRPKAKAITVPVERVAQAILVIRGHKVLLDRELANLYGVTVSRLNEAVKRNRERFPEDFLFRLT